MRRPFCVVNDALNLGCPHAKIGGNLCRWNALFRQNPDTCAPTLGELYFANKAKKLQATHLRQSCRKRCGYGDVLCIATRRCRTGPVSVTPLPQLDLAREPQDDALDRVCTVTDFHARKAAGRPGATVDVAACRLVDLDAAFETLSDGFLVERHAFMAVLGRPGPPASSPPTPQS